MSRLARVAISNPWKINAVCVQIFLYYTESSGQVIATFPAEGIPPNGGDKSSWFGSIGIISENLPGNIFLVKFFPRPHTGASPQFWYIVFFGREMGPLISENPGWWKLFPFGQIIWTGRTSWEKTNSFSREVNLGWGDLVSVKFRLGFGSWAFPNHQWDFQGPPRTCELLMVSGTHNIPIPLP